MEDLAGEAGSQPEPCTERCDVHHFLSRAAPRSPKAGSWMVRVEVGGGVSGCGAVPSVVDVPVILQQFLQSMSFEILFIDRVWTLLLCSSCLKNVEFPQVQFLE